MTLDGSHTIQQIITGAGRKHVLVIGDAIIDENVYSKALGLSLETPTLKARKERTEVHFGGAGLVVKNILELGAHVTFLTVLGPDQNRAHYDSWEHPNLKKEFVTEPKRVNTVKTRYWVGHGDSMYKAFQLNTLDDAPFNAATEQEVLSTLRRVIPSVDLVIMQDHQHGMLTPALISSVKRIAADAKKMVFADSQLSEKASNHELYHSIDMLSLNLKEALALYPEFTPTEQGILSLQKQLRTSHIVVKLGSEGCIALINGTVHRIAAPRVDAIDTCGAGDAFLAALSVSDFNFPGESLQLATTWASISTTIRGTEPPKLHQLKTFLKAE